MVDATLGAPFLWLFVRNLDGDGPHIRDPLQSLMSQ